MKKGWKELSREVTEIYIYFSFITMRSTTILNSTTSKELEFDLFYVGNTHQTNIIFFGGVCGEGGGYEVCHFHF